MPDSLSDLAQVLYLMLPAYLANMAPPFVKYWKGWNRPISRRWLGDHKTVAGFALGVLAALAATYVQSRLGWGGNRVDYSAWAPLGLAFGVGAMGGDSLKSLFKRARSIAPGRSWIPADQLDFILGALALVWPWLRLTWQEVGIVLVVTFVGHIAVNHLACWLGIRDTKW